MKTVPLYGKKAAGRFALVDDEDHDLVAQFRWVVAERKRSGRTHGPYAQTMAWLSGQHRTLKMHFLITGWPMVDHEDHDGLNNQRSNLRPATALQNQHNTRSRSSSTSRFKGVCWDAGERKWLAQIRVGGKNRYLGRFSDEAEAGRHYDMEARRAFGVYAVLNFPEEHPPSVPGVSPAMFPNRDGWVPSVAPFRPCCKLCGGPLRIVSKTGICTQNPGCAAENKRVRRAALRTGGISGPRGG